MFKFLKGLLKVSENVEFKDLPSWIDEKIKPISEKLNSFIENNLLELKNVLEELGPDIEALENAKIKDPDKVQDKVKNVVISNRANYIRLINQYITPITIPKINNSQEALKFCSSIISNLDGFGKDSGKSYYTAQHLFSEDITKVFNHVKDIDNIVKSIISEIKKSELTTLNEIKEDFAILNNSKNKINDLNNKIKEQKDKLTELEKLKEQNNKNLNNFKLGPEYLEYQNNAKEIENINSEISIIKHKFTESISPLTSSFKKLSRISVNKSVAESYSSDAFNTFLDDKGNILISLLDEIKFNIDKLDLKDKKRDKALATISELKKLDFQSLLSSYNQLKKRIDVINRKIRTNESMLKIKDYKYKIEHFSWSIKNHNEIISKLEQQIKEVDIDKLIKNIEEKINKKYNITIS